MRRCAVLLTGAAALGVAGCALLPPPRKPQHAAVTHPQPHPSTAPPSGSAAAAGRLHPGLPPPPVNVVGLSQAAVRGLLGPPAAQSSQGAAQTWTYAGAGCRVLIAFYYDVTRRDFFALSEHLAGGGEGKDCLARIHAAHAS